MKQPTEHSSNGTVRIEERLSQPDTAAALNRLLDRLDTIEEAIDRLEAAMTLAPATAAMAADVVDDAYRSAEKAGVDLDERLHLALQLAERLTAPRTVEVLTKLTDRIERFDRLIEMADRVPDFAAMAVDVFDDAYRAAEQAGHDPEAATRRSMAALVALVESGAFDPAAIETIGKAGDALAACREKTSEKPPEVGLFGLLRALRDPDVRRALGFLAVFGQAFGRQLRS